MSIFNAVVYADPWDNLELMLLNRLRLHERNLHSVGIERLVVHKPKSADKMIVFIVRSDAQSSTLEDEFMLYPSDNLVSRIRLLMK